MWLLLHECFHVVSEEIIDTVYFGDHFEFNSISLDDKLRNADHYAVIVRKVANVPEREAAVSALQIDDDGGVLSSDDIEAITKGAAQAAYWLTRAWVRTARSWKVIGWFRACQGAWMPSRVPYPNTLVARQLVRDSQTCKMTVHVRMGLAPDGLSVGQPLRLPIVRLSIRR